jgi:hypothetical protein
MHWNAAQEWMIAATDVWMGRAAAAVNLIVAISRSGRRETDPRLACIVGGVLLQRDGWHAPNRRCDGTADLEAVAAGRKRD